MKKTALILILCLSTLSYAQDKTSTDTITKKPHREFNCAYVGFSANFNDDLNLNQKLRSQNLPEQNNFLSEIQVGYNFFAKKTSGNFEFGYLFSSPSKNNYQLRYFGFNMRLNYHYNLVNNRSCAITAGVSTAWTINSYVVFEKSGSVDLNNLRGNSGQVSFNNDMFYIGPSASAYLFRKSSRKIKLNVGYEFALTRGRYHNYIGGDVVNNTGESGNNRLIVGLALVH